MRLLLILIIGLSCLTNAQAQTKFYTQLGNEEIYKGQALQVRYIVEGSKEIGEIIIPSYPEFNVLNMYEVPLSQKMDPETKKLIPVYSRVVVLESKKAGSFIIKGAIAEIDGKTLRSNNVRVEVREGSVSETMEEEVQDASEIKQGETIEQKIKENFFLVTEVNKKSIFVGEPVLVAVKAYARLNATSQVIRRPGFSGFSVIEMIDNYDQPPSIEFINGKNYFVHLIRKVQLLPLQPGKFKIDQAEVKSTIQFVRQDIDMNFEEVLKGRSEMRRIPHSTVIKSQVVDIDVKPLPDTNQPKSFNGAVGKYSLLGRMEKRMIQQGSSAVLKLRVNGEGNISLLTAPEVPSTDLYDVGNPTSTEEINTNEYPVKGVKEFEYVITPKSKGNIEIPSVEFAYYDLADKKYKVEATGPINFLVSEDTQDSQQTIAAIEQSGKTIDPKYVAFSLIALGILAWVVYQFLSKKKQPVVEQKAVIPEPVKDPFITIDEAIAGGDHRKALLQMQQVIYGEINKKYTIPASQLNKQEVGNALLAKGVNNETVTRLNALL
ncbi:MAG: BatD family protein, partial [Flavitalea sp.]